MEYKRLTKWDEANEVWIEDHDNDTRDWKNGHNACMTRLAAYEDTEHSPEDLQMIIRSYRAMKEELSAYRVSGLSPEQVQEIAKAKAEDRLVVLPCKVGDKIWMILETVNEEFEIVESVITRILHTIERTYISCWIDCPGVCNSLEFQISDFGKSLFFTKEEAEKSLKERGDTQ